MDVNRLEFEGYGRRRASTAREDNSNLPEVLDTGNAIVSSTQNENPARSWLR